MSKREKKICKKAYKTAVRDVIAFIGLIAMVDAMFIAWFIR